ncbi:MAG TPA: response regulator transcription factor [Vicinamibacterales bacterium]|nr:response regulator transcription factor [Vicinamibacterales bacterium]
MPPPRPRVLLAEDHPAVAKAMGRILSLDCDVVEIVADGAVVVDAWQRHRPVVAVVDVNLPNVSGLDICRDITGADPRAKVIVITGMLDETIRDEALAAGATGFFPKFAPGDDLLAAIRRAWTESER